MSDSCETTCETAEETASPCDLWRLFPLILRYKDAVSSGDLQDDSVLGNFEKVVFALESECGITRQEVENLADLIDADSCDAEFLLYLSATLGELVGEQTRGEDFQRWLIKTLVSFHKMKGTHASWGLQFQWLTNFWRDGWELWKTIAYEEGDYSRVRTYRHLIKAARFDLYHKDLAGDPHFFTPTEAEQYTPFIDKLRPIQVLLRHWHERVTITDSLGTFSETFEIIESISFTEEAPGISDSVEVLTCLYGCEVSCEDTCQGSCEDICELTCEGASCEVACQAGYQTPVHNVEAVSCKFSCEAGACEYGCQVGSCQSGCETCGREVEIFPALIAEIDSPSGVTDSNSGVIRGRVWYPELPGNPYSEPQFPPENGANNPWWLHAPGTHTDFYFNKHGNNGQVYADVTKTTLLPAFRLNDWVVVRCQLGRENVEEHAIRGNGLRKRWQSYLGGGLLPIHICTVQIEANLEALDVSATAAIALGAKLAQVPNPSLFNAGDYIVIYDDNNHESNIVAGTSGALVYFTGDTQNAYSVNPRIARKGIRQVATASDLQTPTATHWYGLFTGDVDDSVAELLNRMDYRTAQAVVTFKDPPVPGSVITSRYIFEETCIYYLASQPQSIRSDTFAFDAEGRFGLKPPTSDGNKYALTMINGVPSWTLVSVGVCPPP